jgi:transposase IS66 family protein
MHSEPQGAASGISFDPGHGRTKTSCFWAIARDDRGWNGSDPPAVIYTYASDRSAEHAIALLKGFVGMRRRFTVHRGGTSPAGKPIGTKNQDFLLLPAMVRRRRWHYIPARETARIS